MDSTGVDSGGINWFDLIVIGFVLLSALVAFLRGFVREALSLVAWIGAGVIAYYLFDPLKGFVRNVVPIQLFADIATAAGLFVVALIVLSFVAGRISKGVAGTEQGSLDRGMGFLFGLARGALMICAAYMVMSWVVPPPEQPDWMRTARTVPLVRDGARELERLVPAGIAAESRLAAGRTEERLRREAGERLLDRLNSPTVAPPAQPAPETGGYAEQQRRDMERLIRGTQ